MISTYIPHYTKLKERKPHIENELNKLGINNAKFITNFDGDCLVGDDMTYYSTTPEYFDVAVETSLKKLGLDRIEQRPLKDSEISLTLKHFEAIRIFLQSASRYAMILEDDAVFNDNVNIQNVVDSAPSDFDALFLGGPLGRDFFNVLDDRNGYLLVDNPATNTTSSIIYSRSGAERLYKAYSFYGFCLPLDWQLNYFFDKLQMKVYHLYPKICGQLSGGEFRSSIQ
jgi:GR25 family glycosyltransferase involved in LPS biosynthesis